MCGQPLWMSELLSITSTVNGFNNKSAKKVMEAKEDTAAKVDKNYEPELIWTDAASAESDEPVDELGEWHDLHRQY